VTAVLRLRERASGTSQTYTSPIGSCIPLNATGGFALAVPCAEAHAVEITGVTDIGGRIDHFPAPNELDAVLGPACRLLAQQYLGHPLDGDLSSSWLRLDQGSWGAGRRTIECLVGHGPTGKHRSVAGSIRSGA